MKNYAYRLLNSIFPSSCLHCGENLENPFSKLCEACRLYVEVSQDDKSICFEKMSPAYNLYQDYLVFHSRKGRALFQSTLVFQYFHQKIESVDLVSLYHPLENKIFSNSYGPLKNIVKSFAKELKFSYVTLFKQKGFLESQHLKEQIAIKPKFEKRLNKKSLLLISELQLTKEKQTVFEDLLPDTKLHYLALFK